MWFIIFELRNQNKQSYKSWIPGSPYDVGNICNLTKSQYGISYSHRRHPRNINYHRHYDNLRDRRNPDNYSSNVDNRWNLLNLRNPNDLFSHVCLFIVIILVILTILLDPIILIILLWFFDASNNRNSLCSTVNHRILRNLYTRGNLDHNTDISNF